MKAQFMPFVLASAAMLAACGARAASESTPVLDRIRASGRITIAHGESSVPFSFVDPAGKPVGYAIDICRRLVLAVRRSLNVDALATEFVMVTSAKRAQTVAEGKADLECGSTSNNAERRQSVAFTIPHYIAGARHLVRADSNIRELPDSS